METAILSLISMAIILAGTMTMAQSTLTSLDATSASWRQAEERMGEIRRTELSEVSVTLSGGGTLIDVTLSNKGEVSLNNFKRWDLVINYTGSDNSYYIKGLAHTDGVLGDNQWRLSGVYLTATTSPEIFEPNIFNPEEEAVFQIKLNPAVKPGSTNLLEVVTPNGVVTSITFNG